MPIFLSGNDQPAGHRLAVAPAGITYRALQNQPSEGDAKFYRGKLITLKYFFTYEIPRVNSLAHVLKTNQGHRQHGYQPVRRRITQKYNQSKKTRDLRFPGFATVPGHGRVKVSKVMKILTVSLHRDVPCKPLRHAYKYQ